MKEAQYTFTPESITRLRSDEILVFGSNYAGRHGAGLAKLAKEKFGAQQGVGRGFTGQCYAIPTKDQNIRTLPLPFIDAEILAMLSSAAGLSTRWFLVTKIGCGLAGYTVSDIGHLFVGKNIPPNVILPVEFSRIIRAVSTRPDTY